MSAPALPLDTRLATTQDQSGFAIVFDEVHLSFEENEVFAEFLSGSLSERQKRYSVSPVRARAFSSS